MFFLVRKSENGKIEGQKLKCYEVNNFFVNRGTLVTFDLYQQKKIIFTPCC
jgi:hypothetical protein